MRAASICMPASERRGREVLEGLIEESITQSNEHHMLHFVLSKQRYGCYCTTTYTP